jgi:hypothetical protein
MPSFSKRQIFTCIRDTIIISFFLFLINNYFIDIKNAQLMYIIIILISFILIYCFFRCLWAFFSSILILASINYYFQHHTTKFKRFIIDFSALFNFFVYLYLFSINIQSLEKFNKIDIYLLIYKAITF